MRIGIDKIGFYAPHFFVDMEKLAEARGVDPAKYTIGIGQEKMAVAPITQDAVTLAANAALRIIDEEDLAKIDLVIFGTESGIDNSKSGAVYVHDLLGIQEHARCIELKQACYGATAGIQLAKGHVALNPESRVLVLGSDISRYGIGTAGEVTQGAGAVAMIISAEPRILALENESSYLTADVMDFWRPIYSETAFVDGKYSNEQYIAFFLNTWEEFKAKYGATLSDFEAICFHLPYTKMGLKALREVLDEGSESDRERLLAHYQTSTIYNKIVGNIYTGSLYLSLLSLLELSHDLKAGDKIGLFSYGSGAVGEFFAGTLQDGFKEALAAAEHGKLFAGRKEVTVKEYEEIFSHVLPVDGSNIELDVESDPATICIEGMEDNKRIYLNKTR
ncbi:hydroxymethylglutaryl-CoA synthase [Trichococcus shcherbakoviae]|uniref:Hydroxymethylglutaryl-CoA synthase n=1 Tax=Trichococcus shcherbakoviae subsp. psychrophilus TaxID=2585775 RepID=A0A5C5EAK0_9LACT|nr:hydroxymethylglutaryl-CoA synthase [Trichococcus shcherbakoviae]TNV70004.1 hydroxymethylglutaryl-CoA synthase [Trichococcus shcherbakoviae subsp. psychrophilus]